ncbi:peptidoglycan DD-metalloendopeptidase family protein [Bradyrhizobium diazoefficiens]|nr:M23 family metallopeptidase [Bradyrhizobium diazoefficiens]MBR0774446.1 peptidoglycan DD-metalloendopeptidase family protein [Bradyrhizobium diazoefficiens]
MPEYKYPGYGATTEDWLTPRAKTKGGFHGGSDNPAKPGTPVYAQYGGEVFRSGVIDGYGMSVVVKSRAPDGTVFYQLYGHLGPDPLPAPGTPITAGEPIPGAAIGTKDYVRSKGGITSGPHLHREIISGKATLNADPNKPFGIYSSDITSKADPDRFDIDRPVFPYQNGEPKPALPPGPTPSPPRSPLARPSLPDDTPLADNPRRPGPAPRQSSGMAVPGAEGPTSLGGPNGPAPLRAAVPMRSQSPGSSAPIADPTLPPLHFAPEMPRMLDRLAVPPSFRSSLFGRPCGASEASFPLEALLARDYDSALDRWAASSPRRDVSPRTKGGPLICLG